jgi:hypothetical protein
MKLAWHVMILIALASMASPALARAKHYGAPAHCSDRPLQFSWWGFLTNPPPGPNGCAPPVYVNGKYVGQDPDPNIRFQLHRDPASGYNSGDFY